MSKGAQIAVGATVIALLVGWYAASNLEAGASFTYYKTLAEFRVAPDATTGAHARVHGYVAAGSIERDVAARQVRFSIQNDPVGSGAANGAPLEVVLGDLETPDLFKDGAEVVIEGMLSGAGEDAVFHADRVLAKCPSKFEPETAAAAL